MGPSQKGLCQAHVCQLGAQVAGNQDVPCFNIEAARVHSPLSQRQGSSTGALL